MRWGTLNMTFHDRGVERVKNIKFVYDDSGNLLSAKGYVKPVKSL